jgi:hypothetical protein
MTMQPVGRAMATTAPAAHTVELVRAEDGALELRHVECRGSWVVPIDVLAGPVTMLDVIHTVIDHKCGESQAAALPRAA